jgi:hypothetical protein
MNEYQAQNPGPAMPRPSLPHEGEPVAHRLHGVESDLHDRTGYLTERCNNLERRVDELERMLTGRSASDPVPINAAPASGSSAYQPGYLPR